MKTAYYEAYNGGFRIFVSGFESGWAPTMESAGDWARRRHLRLLPRSAN